MFNKTSISLNDTVNISIYNVSNCHIVLGFKSTVVFFKSLNFKYFLL